MVTPNLNSRQKKKIAYSLTRQPPDGFRWPKGTKLTKFWNGSKWSVTVTLPKEFEPRKIVICEPSSFGAETSVALTFLSQHPTYKIQQK